MSVFGSKSLAIYYSTLFGENVMKSVSFLVLGLVVLMNACGPATTVDTQSSTTKSVRDPKPNTCAFSSKHNAVLNGKKVCKLVYRDRSGSICATDIQSGSCR